MAGGVGRNPQRDTKGRTHQDAGGPVGQRAVGDVGVSGDPTDVRRAPVDVVRLVIEYQFEGCGGVEHVAADCVENSLHTREVKLASLIILLFCFL